MKPCLKNGIKIVTNLGAANVRGAGTRVRELATALGLHDLKIAIMEGDNLLTEMSKEEIAATPAIEGTTIDQDVIGANIYLGAQPIADAIALGADVVITGRCTDATLTLGPVKYEFGLSEHDHDLLAAGAMAGHLLECGPQVTGAYFADPPIKAVPGLSNVGYPIGEIDQDGTVVISKPEGTGGLVSEATVKEQLLYEIHGPANYLTPDITLDITDVNVSEVSPNRVRLDGARGKPPPQTLKATISMDSGFLGEAEVSYAGLNAFARAELAIQVLRQRFQRLAISCDVRFDILGTTSIFDYNTGYRRATSNQPTDGDYRIRVAARSMDGSELDRISQEVYSLWVTGPTGGAGFRKSITSQVKTALILVDRDVPQVRSSLV